MKFILFNVYNYFEKHRLAKMQISAYKTSGFWWLSPTMKRILV